MNRLGVNPRGVRLVSLVGSIRGTGLYVGDLHANQGDGERSLHTTDVSGRTELEVEVIKDVGLAGPMLLPNESDLPHIAKPYTDEERATGAALSAVTPGTPRTDRAPRGRRPTRADTAPRR